MDVASHLGICSRAANKENIGRVSKEDDCFLLIGLELSSFLDVFISSPAWPARRASQTIRSNSAFVRTSPSRLIA